MISLKISLSTAKNHHEEEGLILNYLPTGKLIYPYSLLINKLINTTTHNAAFQIMVFWWFLTMLASCHDFVNCLALDLLLYLFH